MSSALFPSPRSPAPLTQFFFRCHLTLFAGFFLLACAHYPQCWMYFAPGADPESSAA